MFISQFVADSSRQHLDTISSVIGHLFTSPFYVERSAWPSVRRSCRESRVRRPPAAHVRTIFRSDRPGYPHPVCSELENSGIRVAVGDCSVTERRRWHPPYQTDKTVHVHANTLHT